MNAASGTLRGFGKSSLAALIALFGTCVLRVVWIFTVFRIFPTLESIFISYPISWTATGIVFFIIIFRIFKKKLGESGT
jgi:Na+-driven multidrug efflux pump